MPRLPLLCLALLTFLAPALPAQNDSALTATLQQTIAPFQDHDRGKVSLYAHDLATGRTVAIDWYTGLEYHCLSRVAGSRGKSR